MAKNGSQSIDLAAVEAVLQGGWDAERRIHELEGLEMHLTGTTMYVPARTKEQMDQDHGAPVLAIKTRTFPETGKVWIAPAQPGESEARRLRTTKTMRAANFGFGIQLRKLGVKVPDDRQLIFKVNRIETGQGVIYEIGFSDVENVPRELGESQAAAAQQPKAEKKAEPAAQ